MEPDVHIHYRRPPDREEIFHQHTVHSDELVIVTLAPDVVFDPVRIGGEVVLETGGDAVWLTFPGHWHDIGRFHRADGTFTGFYANILTPPTFHAGGVWRTTDLFLDVWLPAAESGAQVLDREQLEEAVEEGWVDEATRRRAEDEVRAILKGVEEGRWPPSSAREWTRERARSVLGMG